MSGRRLFVNPNRMSDSEAKIFEKYNGYSSRDFFGNKLPKEIIKARLLYKTNRKFNKGVSDFEIWSERMYVRWRRANTRYGLRHGWLKQRKLFLIRKIESEN